MSDNKAINIAEQSIIKQASLLNKEIQPETDLWPAIAQRIEAMPVEEIKAPKSSSWMPMAMAASLFVAVGSLGFAGYTNYSVNSKIANAPIVEQSVVDLIEQPYLLARASYLTVIATDKQQMSPEVRDVLQKNLKIIDDAAKEIHLALETNPNDPFLTDALLLTRQKELALLNQVTSQGQDTI